MRIEPLADRVLVRQFDAEAMSPGGIVLPDQAKEKPKRGRVEAVGPGRIGATGSLEPMAVVVGDTVVFGGYSGIELEEAGETFLLMPESDILAVLR